MKFRRHRRKNYYPDKRMSEEEKFQWVVTLVVFLVCFVFYFISSFISNCIFEWPIRWDIGTCWNEQVQPSKERAIEKAANVMP